MKYHIPRGHFFMNRWCKHTYGYSYCTLIGMVHQSFCFPIEMQIQNFLCFVAKENTNAVAVAQDCDILVLMIFLYLRWIMKVNMRKRIRFVVNLVEKWVEIWYTSALVKVLFTCSNYFNKHPGVYSILTLQVMGRLLEGSVYKRVAFV